MVPRAGFEPATLGLEVLCSIQLSYRGILDSGMLAPTILNFICLRKQSCYRDAVPAWSSGQQSG